MSTPDQNSTAGQAQASNYQIANNSASEPGNFSTIQPQSPDEQPGKALPGQISSPEQLSTNHSDRFESIVLGQNDSMSTELDQARRSDYRTLDALPDSCEALTATMARRYDKMVGSISTQVHNKDHSTRKVNYRDSGIDSARGPRKLAIEQLHWLNIQNAKLPLYKTYFQILNGERRPVNTGTTLDADLSRYCKWITFQKAISKGH